MILAFHITLITQLNYIRNRYKDELLMGRMQPVSVEFNLSFIQIQYGVPLDFSNNINDNTWNQKHGESKENESF